MKQHFQMINDPRFRLVYNEHRFFDAGPAPRKIRLNREGFIMVPGVRKKTMVYPGMLLAEHLWKKATCTPPSTASSPKSTREACSWKP